MQKMLWILVTLALVGEVVSAEPSYTVPEAPWDEAFGLHRAVINVPQAAEAVTVHLPWRRRVDPANNRIIITNGNTEIANIFRSAMSREEADLVFGPVKEPGTYFVYYLPFEVARGVGGYGLDYLPPESAPAREWLAGNNLKAGMDPALLPEIPSATLEGFQSRTAFDSFFPMEIPLSAAELEAFLAEHDDSYLVFPEDRLFPIRMRDELPTRWAEGPRKTYRGNAMRNEYFTYQLGVFAAREPIGNLGVVFSDLSNGSVGRIPAQALTCFNTGGIDCYGKPFTQAVQVAQGEIQPLWMGVDIPQDAVPGDYRGTVTVFAKNLPSTEVQVNLTIDSEVLADRGDADLWRHARLRWLNSTRGTADTPIPPYTAMAREGRAVRCLGREVAIGPSGLPGQITSWGQEILAHPMKLVIETDSGPESVRYDPIRIVHESEGSVGWLVKGMSGSLTVDCTATMEFDGHVLYRVTLEAVADTHLKDVRLALPFRKDIGEYMMGMGRPGGFVPESHDWKWQGPQDSFWMGNADAGIHCELRGPGYHGPLLNRIGAPDLPSWKNGNRGGFRVRRSAERVTAGVYSGERTMKAGESVAFEFALIITPVKQRDVAGQFRNRYFHHPEPREEHIAAGIRIMNIHHANELNPYINYPFVPEATKRLKAFVDRWHQQGMKIKIYYTLRELSNHVHEIWVLRSLGHEVLAGGRGGGYPWLREHLVTDYWPRWYHHFEDGRVCAAIANSGESRWYNYYIESLAWVLENVGVDGLYLDDVTYDRRILKRMRRVMAEVKSDCIIDLHSNTAFSIGPATQYTEFFPYVDKLWFGESFQYNRMSPDRWLVECSGIPFGLMGDMLQGGGNRWLGMVYGMTARMPWTDNVDPRPIWRIWDEFGIEDAEMLGYWEKSCPVETDHPDVHCTAYVKDGKTLIALGSWAPEPVEVHLSIDWRALGLKREQAVFLAPAIKNFQPSRMWMPGESIPVQPLKGWLIMLDHEQREAGIVRKD